MAKQLLLSSPPKNIIVRMPNWLGDFIMAIPILTDLRHHWPETKITAMCQGLLGTIIQEDKNIDSFLPFKKSKGLNGLLNKKTNQETLSFLKEKKFDLGILLTNSFSSAYLFWKGNVQHRIGYATHGRSLLLNYPIPFSTKRENQHLVITYKNLLEPLGIPLSNTAPHLYLTKEELNWGQEKLASYGIAPSDLLIGINPGAAYGSAKCWPPERFQDLSNRLLKEQKRKILFFGDGTGASLIQHICANLPKERVINLSGQTTLRELMVLIQKCDLFLTNDSGPMHVASALGVPLIALFGSTSDRTTGPYGGGKIIHKRVPCSPCYRRECPIDFRCMKKIEVQEVYDEIEKTLR